MKRTRRLVTVYSIFILDEPRTTVYEKLIDYALCKSDAFMLVINRQYDCDIEDFKFILPKQEEFENKMQYQKYLKSCEEYQKEIFVRAQTYKESKKPFLLKLKPYLIKVRHKPEEWPSTKCGDISNKINFDINLYRACTAVRPHLLEPDGLFHWVYPYFPEDLCFFNDGYCWLSTSAHENDAEIYTNNEDDVKVLKNLGLKFKYKEQDIKMFHEEYHTEGFMVR